MHYCYLPSPVGRLLLVADGDGLCRVDFPGGRDRPQLASDWREDPGALGAAIQQLEAYFAGQSTTFQLPLKPRGSAFQLRVWAALQEIPYGQTWSYGQLARHIGRPTASRAVGAANGANPLSIVIPCHRVIGSDGSLTGFGGGLPTKHWLLAHEGVVLDPLDIQPQLPGL